MNNAHALPLEQVLAELHIDPATGLSDVDVAQRRRQWGHNVLPHARPRSLVRMLLEQFLNMIVLLLAGAAAIAWATGDTLEAVAILVVLLLNAAIGFGMEWQAGRALAALRKQTRMTAQVRRSGVVVKISAEDVVPGDIVLLSAGDRVPADLRVIEAAALRAEESPLTGESNPVSKSVDPVAQGALIAERASMLFLGTVVVAGRAVAAVVDTGERTELGKIGRLVLDAPEERTPLQDKLDALGKRLAVVVLVIAVVVIVAGVMRGDELWMMLEVGITLAVAAVPEALPAVTTFILAFGVLRMARQKAIVRRLTAVETLGSTTVICSDKTGTLTMNRMTVQEYRLPDPARQQLLVEVSVLCNDATAKSGDPTEIALIQPAIQHGIDVDALRRDNPRVAEHPFDSGTKRMITIHRTPAGDFLWALKGATRVVLDACDVPPEKRPQFDAMNDDLAGKGLRVLAIAHKRTRDVSGDPDHGFTFLGFVGMLDPPRPGVLEAVAAARGAGIRLIMLTGDQAETARSIAGQLRLTDGEPRVKHASELAGADPRAIVAETDVFARVSPEDKYRIVEALQANGEIVAVTGDGVNDAPALKKSDVGVAMGERGTEVAKEAADIVLADDNFITIVAAIEGGRAIYANIVKFVHVMFSHNLSEVLTIFIAIVLGWPLPLLPLQILWLNLVTDIFPAFALALEPPAPGIMEQPPRPPGESLLSRSFLALISWQAAMLAAIALTVYWLALQRYGAGEVARTMALLSMVGAQIGQMFNCRSRTRSAFEGLSKNPHIFFAAATVVSLQGLALTFAPLRRVLGLAVPPASAWLMVAITIVLPIAIVETQKFIARRRAGPTRTPAVS
ncbi:MAG: HAD-IC family P-type ATPase [Thermoanaerobaculia bacterium]|nr:HAD-IC family P-type ATPase [Thermoanaerobaculia bacterium]